MSDDAAGAEAGIFRKIEVAMYLDERFLALSPVQPSGRSLWLHLLTGPHTNPIPGLSHVGRAAMAEELGWTLEAFEEAFREVFDQGMAQADWDRRVVWLPKAILYNLPQSPNVVRSWGKFWARIPDCDLKIEAHETIEDALSRKSIKFLEPFRKLCPKPSRKAFGKASAKVSRIQGAGSREEEASQEGGALKRHPSRAGAHACAREARANKRHDMPVAGPGLEHEPDPFPVIAGARR